MAAPQKRFLTVCTLPKGPSDAIVDITAREKERERDGMVGEFLFPTLERISPFPGARPSLHASAAPRIIMI